MLRSRSYLQVALLLSIFLAGAGRSSAQSNTTSANGMGPPAPSSASQSQSASATATAPPSQQDFETFVIPSPTPTGQNGTGSPTSPGSQSPTFTRNNNQAPANVGDSVGARIGLTLFPGNSDLGIFLNGKVGGHSLQSQLSPLRWLQGDYAGAGYIELSHDGQGLRLGDGPEDILGNTQSLRLFGLGNTRTGSIGLSLYHDISDENPFSGTPAID